MDKSGIEELEESFGLGNTSTEVPIKKEEPATEVPATEKEPVKAEETSKEETTALTATLVTTEQIQINKDITKLDIQIEALEKQTVDLSAFYNNLEDNLTEEEQRLEFSDKSAYMKLVNTKAKEYETNNTNAEALTKLQAQKQELVSMYDIQSAVLEVSKKYPDYNHEKIFNYFKNDLSKTEQDKIMEASDSYTTVYENTYKSFMNLNPANIVTTPAPNIPNINNSRKEAVNDKSISDGLSSHDEKLNKALGF